ncbi:hypothetical protein BKA81DRAFT_378817 [Phyllosticta paracitricarpa]|uniref:Uncharacterized protein n=1 Tax=Phyllosticta citricarpa TaxID=55181 RepID=A0ABR1LUW8_9PEZI
MSQYLSLSLTRLPRVSHQPRSLGEQYTVRALMQCFLAWRAERVNPISNHRITRLTKKIPRLLILRYPTVSKEPSAASERLSPQSIPSNKDVLSLSRYRAVSNLAPGKPVSRRRWWQTPRPPTPRRRGGLWDEDEDDERDDHMSMKRQGRPHAAKLRLKTRSDQSNPSNERHRSGLKAHTHAEHSHPCERWQQKPRAGSGGSFSSMTRALPHPNLFAGSVNRRCTSVCSSSPLAHIFIYEVTCHTQQQWATVPSRIVSLLCPSPPWLSSLIISSHQPASALPPPCQVQHHRALRPPTHAPAAGARPRAKHRFCALALNNVEEVDG